jgi:nucleotide-binding universal stress UspA family protein
MVSAITDSLASALANWQMEERMSIVQANKLISLKNILFLTDFSEPSVTALPFATMIARSYGSKLTALHVLLPSVSPYMAPDMTATLLDNQEDGAKAEMEQVDAQLAGLRRETIIERGVGVWPVLSRALQERETDLIVLGTHGRTGLKKALLGSSAEEVFRQTTVPVLTIGPAVRSGAHSGGRFRCVLFATDFNAVSSVAAPYAVSLAQENQARLVLLHVLPAPKPGKQPRPGGLSVAEAMHGLEDLVPPDAELWCRPEPKVEHGEPGAQILATAEWCGADLIVLGVRGMDTLTGLATRLERAIAYDVVAHAPCPVLTVRG